MLKDFKVVPKGMDIRDDIVGGGGAEEGLVCEGKGRGGSEGKGRDWSVRGRGGAGLRGRGGAGL